MQRCIGTFYTLSYSTFAMCPPTTHPFANVECGEGYPCYEILLLFNSMIPCIIVIFYSIRKREQKDDAIIEGLKKAHIRTKLNSPPPKEEWKPGMKFPHELEGHDNGWDRGRWCHALPNSHYVPLHLRKFLVS